MVLTGVATVLEGAMVVMYMGEMGSEAMYGLVGIVMNVTVVVCLLVAKRRLFFETSSDDPYPNIKYETKPLVQGMRSDAVVMMGPSEEEEVGEEREEEREEE